MKEVLKLLEQGLVEFKAQESGAYVYIFHMLLTLQ